MPYPLYSEINHWYCMFLNKKRCDMNIQVLVATTDQNKYKLHEKMNIQTSTIIANQGNLEGVKYISFRGQEIIYINSLTRGVGNNRNIALEFSDADICILADDDMKFIDGYGEIVAYIFKENPKIDVIIFNLIEKETSRYVNKKTIKIHKLNYGKYGSARIAFRRKPIQNFNIRFNQNFGGGAKYSAGEDSIFLNDCLNNKLKILAVPYAIAEIDQNSQSTWFVGYNEKFFKDRGALFCKLNARVSRLMAIRYAFLKHKKYKKTQIKRRQALKWMFQGIRDFNDDVQC